MITFAQFGAGRIGRVHAGNVARNGRARLKYIVDPLPEAAQAIAALSGAQAVAAEVPFTDPEVDAILIASTAETHADLILRAVATRKAVFCEKPIVKGLARARECVRAAEEAGVPLFVGYQRRFDPSFASLKGRILAGEIGRPEIILLTSRDPEAPPIENLRNSEGCSARP